MGNPDPGGVFYPVGCNDATSIVSKKVLKKVFKYIYL